MLSSKPVTLTFTVAPALLLSFVARVLRVQRLRREALESRHVSEERGLRETDDLDAGHFLGLCMESREHGNEPKSICFFKPKQTNHCLVFIVSLAFILNGKVSHGKNYGELRKLPHWLEQARNHVGRPGNCLTPTEIFVNILKAKAFVAIKSNNKWQSFYRAPRNRQLVAALALNTTTKLVQ